MNLQQSIANACLGDPVVLSGRVPSRAALASWAENATMKRTMAFMRQAIRELREKSSLILVVDNLRANLGLPSLRTEDLFPFDLSERRNALARLDNVIFMNALEVAKPIGYVALTRAKRRNPMRGLENYKVQLPPFSPDMLDD